MGVFWKTDPKAHGIKEANVERSVMGNKDAAFCELLNLKCGFFLSQTVFDHIIGNVSLLLNELRDVHSGIDEEVFSVPDHAIDD